MSARTASHGYFKFGIYLCSCQTRAKSASITVDRHQESDEFADQLAQSAYRGYVQSVTRCIRVNAFCILHGSCTHVLLLLK